MGSARVRLDWEPDSAEFRMRLDGTGGHERTVARMAYETWRGRAFVEDAPSTELLVRRLPETVTDAMLVTQLTDLLDIDGVAGWLLQEASGLEAFQWPWMWVAGFDAHDVLPELPGGGGFGMPISVLREVTMDKREMERQIRKRLRNG